jgi:adenylate cyclase
LLGLLDDVSNAISIMTRCILNHGGVIGDFQGDSAMGFWGWPIRGADRANRACTAALAICEEFDNRSEDTDRPLTVGIGIASGRGVAGKIGTPDQVKVTVFGPVVNLAARLEGMTRKINVPILVDEPTALSVRQVDALHVRPIANIVPFGLNTIATVGELLSGHDAHRRADGLARFREGAEFMRDGDWAAARESLQTLKTDGAAQFLLDIIRHHGGRAPAGWDGIIRMQSK